MDPSKLTSWTLILGAAAGEPVDREGFSLRYSPVLRAYFAARWRVDRDDDAVLDATQDVMLECFKDGGALERVDPSRSGGFRAYLYGVARKVALMAERRAARRRDGGSGASLELDDVRSDDATLSVVFDRAFAQSLTRQARELMARRSVRSPAGEARFRALSLQFERGLPPREVAAAMGEPIERIYELLREARGEFREALLDVVKGLHPGSSRRELEERCTELLQRLR